MATGTRGEPLTYLVMQRAGCPLAAQDRDLNDLSHIPQDWKCNAGTNLDYLCFITQYARKLSQKMSLPLDKDNLIHCRNLLRNWKTQGEREEGRGRED